MTWEPNIKLIVDDEVHRDFLREAYSFGFENANDRSTKNGSVLVKDGRIIAYGCSGLPPYVLNAGARHEYPLKEKFVKHAEQDAILMAASAGIATKGTTLYVPWYACARCAHDIAGAKIGAVIGHETALLRTPERWQVEVSTGIQILLEAGVQMALFRGSIGGVEMLMDKTTWNP
jgi:deoxycytidylate deaminase